MPGANLVDADTKDHGKRRLAADPRTMELLRAHRVACAKVALELGASLPADAYVLSYAPESHLVTAGGVIPGLTRPTSISRSREVASRSAWSALAGRYTSRRSGQSRAESRDTMLNHAKRRERSLTGIRTVELLYWNGCPSHEEAIELVQSVLDERGITPELVVREVTSDEEAEALHFPGSPTIRVDGRDVDPAGGDARPALTCRIYRLEDGRVSPVPSRKQLRDALR